jgi:hypothetical protein
MKGLITGLVVLGFFAGTPVMAAGGNNDKESASAAGSPAPATSAAPARPAEERMEQELQELRDLLVTQGKQFQEQNNQLKEQFKEQQQRVQSLEEQLSMAKSARENLATPETSAMAADPAIGPTPNIGITAAGNAGNSGNNGNGGGDQDNADGPLAIHVKGITLTPGGFMEGAEVWRQRALSADVTTPFNSVPYPASSQSQVSEFNFSGRQSRIAMLAEGKLNGVKIGGYYETDFLGVGATSNYTESNSYVLRQRQFWGQAAFESGWTITGGQMWTLVTETKHGVDNRTEDLPMVIDGSYHVGFSWARQPGIRITKDFGNRIWLGFSIENAETTLTAHAENNNFLVGTFGASGGSLNPIANYAFTKAPDFIFKAAFEPGWGHYEVFGVVSTFRDRVFPNETATVPSAVGAFNDGRVGGGVGANARVPLFHKKLDAGLHFFGGDGIGRYGASTLADVTVRPNGTLAPIRNFQSLGTLEFHATPKIDVYAYVGGEYNARTAYVKSGITPNEGYGAIGLANFGCSTEPVPGTDTSTPNGTGGATGFVPGSIANCTGDTRNVIEGTLGFWYRFYKGSKGTVQWGPQYSYVVRNAWSGAGATAGTIAGSHGVENEAMTSFRYVLP